MERRVCREPGGTLSLLSLIEEHSEAIEFDLLERKYRLRWLDDPAGNDFNWRDLWVLVRHLGPDSALHIAMHGRQESEWTLANHLLAMTVENTSLLVWMKTKDAQRDHPMNRPKPIFRPGVEDDSKKTIGGDTLVIEDMIAFLGPGYESLAISK